MKIVVKKDFKKIAEKIAEKITAAAVIALICLLTACTTITQAINILQDTNNAANNPALQEENNEENNEDNNFDNMPNANVTVDNNFSTTPPQPHEIPHPFATSLVEFNSSAIGKTAAVLVDFDNDGTNEMLAIKADSVGDNGVLFGTLAIFSLTNAPVFWSGYYVGDFWVDLSENHFLYLTANNYIVVDIYADGQADIRLLVLGYANGTINETTLVAIGDYSQADEKGTIFYTEFWHNNNQLDIYEFENILVAYGVSSVADNRFAHIISPVVVNYPPRLFWASATEINIDHTPQVLAMTVEMPVEY